MRILLIEDTVGAPIRRVLETWGHQVSLAQSGAEGRQLLAAKAFDFMLVDWMLPDLSGLDLVKEIRQDERHREAAILMISSRTARADIVTAIRSGIDGYVAKPFKAGELRGKIDEIWQRRSRGRAQAQQVRMILDNQENLQYAESAPLIVFGEGSVDADELAKIWHAHLLEYLSAATTAIAAANAFQPHLQLGYHIATSTGEVTRLLKERQTANRVQMAFISTDCYGNCVLMARLIHMRQNVTCPICIVCSQHSDLNMRERRELEQYNALVFDRRELDAARWRDIIEEYILDTSMAAEGLIEE